MSEPTLTPRLDAIVHTLFFVTDKRGTPLQLCDLPDAKNILMIGDHATGFTSRRAANRAIARTRQYESQEGLRWDTWAFKVNRMKVV